MDKGDVQASTVAVGARPAGSSAAHYLATADLRVLLPERSALSRGKVCGDGLMSRVVVELVRMGVDTSGRTRNIDLRAVGDDRIVELPWPEMVPLLNFGLACPCAKFDVTPAAKAQESEAILCESVIVAGPAPYERSDRTIGAKMRSAEHEPLALKAPAIVDAGGISTRLAIAVGYEKAMNRPIGVVCRMYFRSGYSMDSVMKSHLELWKGKPGESDFMLGYGWIFLPVGRTVNVGLGSLSPMVKATGLDYRAIFEVWMANVPSEWGFMEENQVGRLYGAALPIAFNRKPHYTDGPLLVGDADGMVLPLSGKGTVYAPQAGCLTVDIIVQAHSHPTITAEDRAPTAYPMTMRRELSGYYSLGRALVRFTEYPWIAHMCVVRGLPWPMPMRPVMRLPSNCYDHRGGDWTDRFISALAEVVPKA